MSNEKDIRWEQRLTNYNKALSQLIEGLDIEHPSKVEKKESYSDLNTHLILHEKR